LLRTGASLQKQKAFTIKASKNCSS